MYLIEFFDKIPDGYHSDKDDNTAKKMTDVRSTRLTIARIRQLRKMNDVKKFEKQQKMQKISTQYKPPAAAAEATGL